MGTLYVFPFIFGRSSRSQGNELNKMQLEIGNALRSCRPLLAFCSMKQAAAGNGFALPIHPRILQSSIGEIIHNRRDAFLAAEPLKKRLFRSRPHAFGSSLAFGGP